MRLPGVGEIILIAVIAAIVIIGVRVFGTPPPKKAKRKVQYESMMTKRRKKTRIPE
jgi:hypothetical protein